MKKVFTFLLFAAYHLCTAQVDTAAVPHTNIYSGDKFLINTTLEHFRIHDGTYSYRSGNSGGAANPGFFDKTTWNSSPYKAGYLDSASNFRMNYRYLEPTGYDPAYSPGYPLVVMLEGAVERANCYTNTGGTQCYYGTKKYKPHYQIGTMGFPPIITDADRNNLFNNDHQLLNGGQAHLTARNKANGKKPNDPTLDPKSFPGFVLFPQMLNGWDGFQNSSWMGDINDMIRIVRLMIKTYNIDPNRIYIHGLSNGGRGTLTALYAADWLFAAAAPMSAINSPPHNAYRQDPDILNIPIWFFQGGKDGNPKPADTEATVSYLLNRGANVRYTLYPNLGHGTWNTAYAEPDFWSWLLSKNKSDIHVYGGGVARVCATTGAGARMYLSREFYAYQWERNGVIIPGATSYTYTATTPGTYRARFSRKTSNPTTESDWNQWSKPVEVGTSAPPVPVVTNTKSVMLPDLNGSIISELIPPPNYFSYRWWHTTAGQSSITTYPTNYIAATTTMSVAQPSPTRTSYNYYVRVSEIDGCYTDSKTTPRTVWFQDGIAAAPNNAAITIKPAITGFTGVQTGVANVLLQWNDVNWERNYEIWRSPSTTANSNNWTLVTITGEDATLYVDKNLKIGVKYYYKIRAISESARCPYAPSDNKNGDGNNVVVTITSTDLQKPTVPQNVQAGVYDTDVDQKKMIVRVSWNASTDNVGVEKYRINYNGSFIETADASTTIDVPGLTINTNYAFTVQALDANSNISSPSAQVNVLTKMDGVYYVHNTAFYSDLTEINEAQWNDREFFNHLPNIDINEATQDSYFLMKFYGYLYISQAGEYQFKVNHNDGVRLKVNDQVVILTNSYVQQGCIETGMNQGIVTLNLPVGYVPIELRYWQSEDDRCLTWEYSGLDTENIFVAIPNNRLTTMFDPVQPPIPSVPEEFTVTATGMDEISLTWTTTDDPSPNFEVQRSLTSTGPWTMIEAVSTTSYVNNGLVPATEYFYRIRSINSDGVSAYTEIKSATTFDDEIAPSAPTNLTLTTTTLTSASIAWTESTDNVEVTGYRIYVTPQGNATYLHSTVQTTYAAVTGLTAQTNYTIYVTAIDAMENESGPSNTILASTVGVATYYHKGGTTAPLSITTNWGNQPTGLGTPPDNFTTNGYYFNVRVTQSRSDVLSVAGSASKVIIPDGVNLVFTAGGVQGNLEIQGNGALTLINNIQPVFGQLSESSTVRYTSTAAQQVQAANYGNLVLSGSGSTKIFQAGTTIIRGNLTVSSNVAISGAADNGSTIILYGDLIGGTPLLFTASTNAVNLEIRKPADQNFSFGGQLNLNQLIVSEPIQIIQNTAGTLNLGSNSGGGLSLVAGSSISVPPGSTLKISGAGTINSNGETGKIYADGGTVDITSSSEFNSRLYFDEAIYYSLSNLNANLSGTGNVQILNPLEITSGIKLRGGDLLSNGNITLISNVGQTANLEQIEGSGRFVGNLHVQRYFSSKPNMYRYIATPVANQKVSDWQQVFSITGNFTGRSPGSTSPSLYVLGNLGQWVAYPTNAQGGSGAPIARGKGYAAYIRNSGEFTMTSTGDPFQGDVPFTLYPLISGFDGWNLLGNPYASSIQWSNSSAAWTANQLGTFVAVRNNSGTYMGQFMYYDGTTTLGTTDGLIAQGQAFYVQATGASPALTIHEGAKYVGQQELYRMRSDKVSHMFIALRKGDMIDKAIVTFTDFGDNSYQMQYDASKLKNEGIFNFSTLTSDGTAVAINNMSNSFCDTKVNLNIQDVEAGEYVLEFPDFSTLYGIGSMELIDHYAGSTIDLSTTSQYPFNVTADSSSFGKTRFEVVMNRPDLEKGILAAGSVQCFEAGKITLSNTQRGATYSIYDPAGNLVSEEQLSSGDDLVFSVPTSKLKAGVNEFRISAGFDGCGSEMLSQNVEIEHYENPALELNNLSTCFGSPAFVTVSSTSDAIVGYNWYTSENTRIKGFESNNLETVPVTEETLYSVSAILKNGCEGPRYGMVVYPVNLSEPELVFANDSLHVSAGAEQYEWTLNGEKISDASHNAIAALAPGVYQVICKSGGCMKTSKEFSITGNEDDPNIALQYQLYPNPASSGNINLRVITPNREEVLVKVIDVLGKEHYVNSFNPEELKNSVKISPRNAFHSGVYYMILKQGSRFREIKFIVAN
jgi:predicted esterase